MNTRLPDFRECLAALIATPSISSVDPLFDMSNRPLADLLAGWFESLGFSVEYLPVPGRPEKVNLLAAAGRGEGGLVLSGHMDTVPCTASAWSADPFRLVERDGRWYGLGTTDMKSFFALAVEVLRELDLSKLRRPLYLLATCDEESSMAGAEALSRSGRALGRHALIGEPTGLKPVNLHKGAMVETVRLIGRGGHSSDPALGVSAIEGMHTALTALMEWRNALQAEHRDLRFRVPVPTLNFGCIHGGDNANRISENCELTMDLRPLPGMDIEDTRAGMRRTVMEAIDGRGLAVEFTSVFPGMPPMETPATAEIVRVAERLSGASAESVAFATEGPYLNAMGMQTVVLGPGDIAQAHQADEYLAIERAAPMQRILKEMIGHFCLREK
jgi:acetylornithine deacetylase